MEGTETPSKPRRKKRMKAIFTQIRGQMEFYFSDSNLARDRFMKQQISQSEGGYLELQMFLKFKKIACLTQDVKDIAKALSKSEFFQLNEDLTKVRRKTEIHEPKDIDERTVYVECLPWKADHTWIRNLFSNCGNIMYISIPKYKSTGDAKGFAFVEFETIEGAKKACQDLNNPPVNVGHKTGMFPKYNKQLLDMQKKLDCKLDNQDQERKTDISKPRKGRKRRQHTSDSSIDGSDVSPKKRRNTHSTESQDASETEFSSPSKKKRKSNSRDSLEKSDFVESVRSEEKHSVQKRSKKRKQKLHSDTSESETQEGTTAHSESETKSKGKISKEKSNTDETIGKCDHSNLKDEKKRKLTVEEHSDSDVTSQKKQKLEAGVQELSTVSDSTSKRKREKRKRKKKHKDKSLPELRVISKLEWLELKKEYLTLQKESMNELKQNLKKIKKQEDQTFVKGNKAMEVTENKPTIEAADTVVLIRCGTSMSRKQIKDDLGPDVQIAYVDIKDGETEGHVRFKDSQSARKVAESTTGPYQFTLLSGAEELSYWKKLQADKKAKYNKPKKHKKGQQKVLIWGGISYCGTTSCCIFSGTMDSIIYQKILDDNFLLFVEAKFPNGYRLYQLIEKAQKINKENMDKIHIRFTDDE